MSDIIAVNTTVAEIVLSERVVSNEFKVIEMHESVQNRFVRVEVEIGPFVTEDQGGGITFTRGSSRRSILVWQNEAYDAVRDTWNNLDLLALLPSLLV